MYNQAKGVCEYRYVSEFIVMSQSLHQAEGKSRFVLGYGTSGIFGHVELMLQVLPVSKQFLFEWQVKSRELETEVQEQVKKAVNDFMSGYVSRYSAYGFLVIITDVTSDIERRNDYGRAVNLALRSALEKLNLPTPQIFSL